MNPKDHKMRLRTTADMRFTIAHPNSYGTYLRYIGRNAP